MSIIELTNSVKYIATNLPNVNSFYDGDVYSIMDNEEVKYSSVIFNVNASSKANNVNVFDCTLYYLDRLTEDVANRQEVMDDAVNYITVIINTLNKNYQPIEITQGDIVLVDQEFADYIAGGYVNISITVPSELGQCGFVPGPIIGGDGVKKLNIDKNGEYKVRKDSGVPLNRVDVNVNVPPKIDLQQLGFSEEHENQYNKYYQDGIEYAKKVQDEWVDKTSQNYKFQNNNKLVFFPKVPMDNMMYCNNMFYNCINLEGIEYFDASKLSSLSHTFYNCRQMRIFPTQLDTSNVVNWHNAFAACNKLEYLPPLDISKANTLRSTFQGCTMLKELPFESVDASKLTYQGYGLYYTFSSCTKLEHIVIDNSDKYAGFLSLSFHNTTNLKTITRNNEPFYMVNQKTTQCNQAFQSAYAIETPMYVDAKELTSLYYTWYGCNKLHTITILNCEKVTNWTHTFYNHKSLKNLVITGWKQGEIVLTWSPLLEYTTINEIIDKAVMGSARKLRLHKDVYDRWIANPEFDKYSKLAATKGITIAK